MSIPFTLIRLSENDYLACLVISTRVWGDLGIVYQYRYPHPSAHLAALASHFNGEQSEWRRF